MYVIANISGRLNEFLLWKEKNKIKNSDIIIGGNFIGRHGGHEIIKYMQDNYLSFAAVLAGKYEESLIEWTDNELLVKNTPERNAYLLDTWFNYGVLTKETIQKDILFLKNLSSIYKNVNSKDDYLLYDKFIVKTCSVKINKEKIFLPDKRDDMSVCYFD